MVPQAGSLAAQHRPRPDPTSIALDTDEPRRARVGQDVVSRRLGLVPGLFQWRSGQRQRGAALAGGSLLAFGAAVATGAVSIYYGNQAEDWRGDYLDLPRGLPQLAYDEAFDTWHDYEERSDAKATQRNLALALLGVVYALNWYDVLTSQDAANVGRTAVRPVITGRGAGLRLVRFL